MPLASRQSDRSRSAQRSDPGLVARPEHCHRRLQRTGTGLDYGGPLQGAAQLATLAFPFCQQVTVYLSAIGRIGS